MTQSRGRVKTLSWSRLSARAYSPSCKERLELPPMNDGRSVVQRVREVERSLAPRALSSSRLLGRGGDRQCSRSARLRRRVLEENVVCGLPPTLCVDEVEYHRTDPRSLAVPRAAGWKSASVVMALLAGARHAIRQSSRSEHAVNTDRDIGRRHRLLTASAAGPRQEREHAKRPEECRRPVRSKALHDNLHGLSAIRVTQPRDLGS